MVKKSKYTLMAAWLLLFCFVAGQVIVYSHQHHILKQCIAKVQDKQHHNCQQVTEKCKLCDTMHSDHALVEQYDYMISLQPAAHFYPSIVYNFPSFGLILADGRSPPLS